MGVLRFIPSDTFNFLIQIDFDIVTLPQNLRLYSIFTEAKFNTIYAGP